MSDGQKNSKWLRLQTAQAFSRIFRLHFFWEKVGFGMVGGLFWSFCVWAQALPPIKVQVFDGMPWWIQPSQEDSAYSENKARGIWPEILNIIEEKAHVTFEILFVPIPRSEGDLADKPVDLRFGELHASQDQDMILLSELFTYKLAILPHPHTELKSYQDLARTKVGIVRGTTAYYVFENDPHLIANYTSRNYDIILEMLFNQRLEAIAGDQITLLYLRHFFKIEDRVAPLFFLKPQTIWAKFSKKSRHLEQVENLRQALIHLHRAGAFQQILDAYSRDLLD